MNMTIDQLKTFLAKDIAELEAKRAAKFAKFSTYGFGRSLWDIGATIIALDVEINLNKRVLHCVSQEAPLDVLADLEDNIRALLMQGPDVRSTSMLSNAVGMEEWTAHKSFLNDIERFKKLLKMIAESNS